MNSLQPSAFNLAPPPTLQWQPVQIANFNAIAGRAYPVNTTSAAITVTLPASPSAGDQITLTDYAGTWGANNLTVNRNGNYIQGVAANATLNISRASVQLTYIDSIQGWLPSSSFKIDALFIPIDYLIVGGGGAGGCTQGTTWGAAGGGGGGGYRTATQGLQVVPGSTYTITVGNGGARVTDSTGSKGGDSSISGASIPESPIGAGTNTFKSYGGGGGGGPGLAGTSGGSGGGSAAGNNGAPGNTPATTPSQGNSGGNGNGSTSPFGAGGGGGAGAVGASAAPNAGNGGAGILGPSYASSYGGAGPGGTPSTGYFSGGGGGGATGGPISTGGIGGGANGGANTGGTNTGGGGGGAIGNAALGGSGGSGIVIIRYQDIFPAASSTTGSPTITVSGGYRVYAWLGNGSITF